MGKKQHQKDKLYLSRSEWINEWGGRKQADIRHNATLPFNHCALSLAPAAHPVITADGTLFDKHNITLYIDKHHTHPITKLPLEHKDLIDTHIHHNDKQQPHCPLTYKVFNQNSHIVAIQTSGNVYAYEAVRQFNIKPAIWRDLLTDQPFTKEDIITLQHHALDQRRWIDANEQKNAKSAADTVDANEPTKKKTKTVHVRDSAEPLRSTVTSGECAASFTSTSMKVTTENKAVPLSDKELRDKIYLKVRALKNKAKAYATIRTTKGDLLFILHCDKVPETCHNFILLAEKKYFSGIKFHRLIQGFMVQGGDPTGSGRGGNSAWGSKFDDEICDDLKHNSRGILSMANAGPNTNGSQFFLTFAPCPHLDGKHSVFGEMVEGESVLRAIEGVPVDSNDKPMIDIVILEVNIESNPFKAVDDSILSDDASRLLSFWKSSKSSSKQAPSVGKYLN